MAKSELKGDELIYLVGGFMLLSFQNRIYLCSRSFSYAHNSLCYEPTKVGKHCTESLDYEWCMSLKSALAKYYCHV